MKFATRRISLFLAAVYIALILSPLAGAMTSAPRHEIPAPAAQAESCPCCSGLGKGIACSCALTHEGNGCRGAKEPAVETSYSCPCGDHDDSYVSSAKAPDHTVAPALPLPCCSAGEAIHSPGLQKAAVRFDDPPEHPPRTTSFTA